MVIVKSCCCFNLRTGSIASGIFTLMMALTYTGMAAYNIYGINSPEETVFTQELANLEGWCYAILVFSFGLLMSSILLIVGAVRDNRFFFIPWMIIILLMMLVDVVSTIYDIVIFGFQVKFNILQAILLFMFITLNIYCLLCVVSQYQELKVGRGRASDYTSQQSVSFRPAINEVFITAGPAVHVFAHRTRHHSGQRYEQLATMVSEIESGDQPPSYKSTSIPMSFASNGVLNGSIGPHDGVETPPTVHRSNNIPPQWE